ncbi:MAG: KH domain-containing protein [Desulfovibrio sp.]|jgi:predicted RNA-binding protein YlqC (UPF0109 family)|nr:KH domain-containing protein [Desulfovibrio sp.]
MKELTAYIIKALVDNPDAVCVTETERDQALVIELTVDKEDVGKVIGKQGRTIRAVRSVLSAASTRLKKRVLLEIQE